MSLRQPSGIPPSGELSSAWPQQALDGGILVSSLCAPSLRVIYAMRQNISPGRVNGLRPAPKQATIVKIGSMHPMIAPNINLQFRRPVIIQYIECDSQHELAASIVRCSAEHVTLSSEYHKSKISLAQRVGESSLPNLGKIGTWILIA